MTREEKISLDFSSAQIKTVRLHQWDHLSTNIVVQCTDCGDIVKLASDGSIIAQIKWLKPDMKKVFKEVTINSDGTVTIPCDEQMLIKSGTVKAELQLLGQGCILHTMPFHVVVIGETFSNDEAASKDEVTALTEAMSHITQAVEISKNFPTWQQNENTRIANESTRDTNEATRVQNETTREINEAIRVSNENSRQQTLIDIKDNVDKALVAEATTKGYMDNAKISEDNAKVSEDNAKTSETNAKTSEDNAKASETNSAVSETNAKKSENNALDYSTLSRSYAVGDTGTRPDETIDNAKYYAEDSKHWAGVSKAAAGGDFVTTPDVISDAFIDSLFQ